MYVYCYDALRGARVRGLRKDESYDETVQAQGLREDKNKDHAHEELFLLSDGSYTGVSHNPDSHSCRQAAVDADQKDKGWRSYV